MANRIAEYSETNRHQLGFRLRQVEGAAVELGRDDHQEQHEASGWDRDVPYAGLGFDDGLQVHRARPAWRPPTTDRSIGTS